MEFSPLHVLLGWFSLCSIENRWETMKKSILFTLILSTFVVGTVELIIAGILELIGRDLNVSLSSVGQLITVYAFVAAIGGPILVTFTAKIEQKRLLLVSLTIFISGNFMAAISSSYGVLMTSRIVVALSAAVFEIVALTITARLVPEESRGKMLGFVYSGFSAANVFGVPIGTMLGIRFGWRMTFIAIVILSIICFISIVLTLPNISPQAQVPMKERISVLKNPFVVNILLLGTVLLSGHYVVYAYISPLLTSSGYTASTVSLFLFIFGIAGTIGTSLGGILTDRMGVQKTLSIMVILFIISLFSLPFVLHSFVLFILISLVWSVTIWGISSPIQYYLIKAAPQSADLALSLNISALNIGIALGSLVGGAVLLKLPVTTEPWIGGTFGIVGLALLFLLKKMSVNQMK